MSMQEVDDKKLSDLSKKVFASNFILWFEWV